MTETGWGEFPLQIRLTFIQEANEKPIHIVHNLKLHHYLPVVPAPVPGSAEAASVGQAVPAAEAGQGAESATPMEVDVGAATEVAGVAPVTGVAAQMTGAGQTKVRATGGDARRQLYILTSAFPTAR